jgi:hypothetical protein
MMPSRHVTRRTSAAPVGLNPVRFKASFWHFIPAPNARVTLARAREGSDEIPPL